jgi:nucleotide-binding universal stress UspA family protein
VVGVDGSANSASALRWALHEAALRGDRVIAFFAWGYTPLGTPVTAGRSTRSTARPPHRRHWPLPSRPLSAPTWRRTSNSASSASWRRRRCLRTQRVPTCWRSGPEASGGSTAWCSGRSARPACTTRRCRWQSSPHPNQRRVQPTPAGRREVPRAAGSWSASTGPRARAGHCNGPSARPVGAEPASTSSTPGRRRTSCPHRSPGSRSTSTSSRRTLARSSTASSTARTSATSPHGVERILVRGGAARAVLDTSQGADLVVLGTRGLGGFTGLLLGSVTHHVAHHVRCPLVVIP